MKFASSERKEHSAAFATIPGGAHLVGAAARAQ